MRLQYTLVSFLCALSCAERIGARQGLRIRQDSTSDATTTTDQPQSSTASDDNTTSSPTPTSTNDEPKTTSKGESHSVDATSPITPTGTATDFPTSTVGPLPGSNSTTDANELPIQPKINAPLGVAGALLLIAGLGLGFVGVRNRSVQTFLSTALLMALGCEVLIFYLMHPPVPVAVQAAYLIAGVAGGLLLGGLSLIFKEVSEGFGCVLGGFCFAMWILVLSPGGSITNKVGKIILIAVLCALGYASYISRFTRVYGLIVCTSFAGATAFVLGIDCFSRAGLKEFWLYIWDLNDNEFPLFTDTYPITRPMRAEIAAIIIVCFLGTMSQIKIWKIVKEQKAKHDAQRIQDEEARDALEEEVGRDVESRNRRSLDQWEQQYDGKKGPLVRVSDSGVGSSIEEFGKEGSGHYDVEGISRRDSYPLVHIRPPTTEGERRSSSRMASSSNKRLSAAPSLPEFKFGEEQEALSCDGEHRSIHASQAGTPGTEPASPGLSVPDASLKERRGVAMKRLSLQSLAQKEALEAAADGGSPFEEEDDVASSVAATAAEPPDADALSMKLSRPNSMYMPQMPGGGLSPSQQKEEFIEEDDDEALGVLGTRKSIASGSSPRIPQTPGTPGTADPFETAEPVEKTALADRLPKKMSKAAANYRTNEWAKEVGRAEQDPIEEVHEHTDGAVQIEMGNAADAARADENNAAPAPPPPPPAPPAPPKANQKERRRSSQHLSRTPPVPVYSHDRRTSGDSWSVPLAKRASSNPIQSAQPTPTPPAVETNNIPAPILEQGIVDSPIDQQPQSPPKPRPVSRVPSLPNLMDARQERMDKRLTSTSFNALGLTSSSNLVGQSIPEDQAAAQGSREGSQGDKTSLKSVQEGVDEEDMTLAERRALVQRQSSLPNPTAEVPPRPRHMSQQAESTFIPHAAAFQQANASAPRPPKPVRLSSQGPAVYDSHQPRRASSHNATKQAQNWSAWRSSNAIAQNSRQHFVTGDNQIDMLRAAYHQDQREKTTAQQRQQAKQEKIDQAMRMGAMNDAHRNALAKMQANANKKAE